MPVWNRMAPTNPQIPFFPFIAFPITSDTKPLLSAQSFAEDIVCQWSGISGIHTCRKRIYGDGQRPCQIQRVHEPPPCPAPQVDGGFLNISTMKAIAITVRSPDGNGSPSIPSLPVLPVGSGSLGSGDGSFTVNGCVSEICWK